MLVVTILLVLFGWTLFGPVIGFILSTGIAALLGLVYVQKFMIKHRGKKQSIDWKSLPLLVRRGFSYSLTFVIFNVKIEIFILILAIFNFYSEISYLRLGVYIATIFYLFFKPIF